MSIPTKAPGAARLSLGAIFLLFGANGFLQFLPQPELPPAALPFIGGLAAAGYFFPFLKGIEVIAGALLLANRFVPLVLAVLAPIVVNIVLYHLFLVPSGLALAGLVLALELYLAWSYRAAYRTLLAARHGPSAAEPKALAEARAAAH